MDVDMQPTTKPVWCDLEHRLNQEIKKTGATSKFVLLVSGGADSMALLRAFARVLGVEQFSTRAEILHFHHGEIGVSEQVRLFREQSQALVTEAAREMGCSVRVVKNNSGGVLSEDQARQFRHDEIRKLVGQNSSLCFVFGHHKEDLLETRFLRILRGTGVQGLGAMDVYSPPYFRPWLEASRKELEEYLVNLKQAWVTDPQQEDLRSWLRHRLFPQIESRLPGALASMARSLEQILSNSESVDFLFQVLLPDRSLSHPLFLCLSREQQRQVLAQYLYSLGQRDYSRGQIDEILKCLDKTERVHTFKISGLNWEINAEQIRGLPVPK